MRFRCVILLVQFILLCGQGNAAVSPRKAGVTLRSISEIWSKTPEERDQGLSYEFHATVTYHDPAWRMLFVRDGTGSMYMTAPEGTGVLKTGEDVLLRGTTKAFEFSPQVTPARRRRAVPARMAQAEEIANGSLRSQMVQIPMMLRTVRQADGKLLIHGSGLETFFEVRVREFPRTNYFALIEAEVVITGVLGETVRVENETFHQVWVESWDQVEVVKTRDHFASELVNIGDIAGLEISPQKRKRVRVKARIASHTVGSRALIRDETGELFTSLRNGDVPVYWGDQVEVAGYPGREGTNVVLKYAVYRWEPQERPVTIAEVIPERFESFTRIGPIRQLTPEESGGELPVKISGVVTYADPGWNILFVQDQSGGIFVYSTNLAGVTPGTRVAIEGITQAGNFAPTVAENSIRKLGRESLPQPKGVTLEKLLQGTEDSQWIALEGIVQEITVHEERVTLTVFSGNDRFEVQYVGGEDSPEHLVDARVRIEAVAASVVNNRRQLQGIILYTPGLSHIRVLQPGAPNPFSRPVTPIQEIGRFRPEHELGHRIRVRGRVTHFSPGKYLYIEDESGAVRIKTRQTSGAARGDLVEAAGFAELARYTPSLRNGIFRRVERGEQPGAVALRAEEVLNSSSDEDFYDARLVEMEGEVLDKAKALEGEMIILRQGGSVFYGQLEGDPLGNRLAHLVKGSIVRLRGICTLQLDQDQRPESFVIMARDPRDITIVQPAAWWTHAHWVGLALSFSLLALVSAGWAVTLRRTVRKQTKLIRKQYEREAALARVSTLLSAAQTLRQAARIIVEQFATKVPMLAGQLELYSRGRKQRAERLLVKISGSGIAADASAKGLPEFSAGLESDEARIIPPGERCARWLVYLPVRNSSVKTGGFLLVLESEIGPGESELKELQMIADHSAAALERIRAEESSQQNEERFQYASKATTDIVWDWEISSNRVTWSDTFSRLIGGEANEREPDYDFWLERLHPEDRDRIPRSLAETLEGQGQDWTEEYRFRRNDGSYAYVLDRGFVIRERGKAVRMIGAMLDISARKQIELELAEAKNAAEKASKAKSDFLAMISHEIRTPMNGIIGMTQLLLQSGLAPEQREFAETLRRSGESLLSLMNDLLDFSKIEAGKMEFEQVDFELRKVIEDVLDLLAIRTSGKDLELAACLPAELPMLKGDPGRIRQVLLNLVGNGVKFTEQGEVVVKASVQEDDGDALVRVEVRDTGVGLAPEIRERLFQPFSQADSSTTRRYGGTGLGLVISKRLVEQMGGEIGLESTPGEGSTFWFALKLAKAGRAVEVSKPALLSGKVLVVDDNQTVRTILSDQISSWGMQPVLAENRERAAARLREEGTMKPFDVLILDAQMPGSERLVREIKSSREFQAMKIILLAPLGENFEPGLRDASGMATRIPKPFRQSDLREALIRATIPQPERDSAPEITPEKPGRGKGIRLLLAEDNRVNQKVAVRQLQKLGYIVDVVDNGREALEALAYRSYAAILMDCQMPVMDGYEATRQIRTMEVQEKQTPIPIIAMTAHAMAGDRETCLAQGMSDYIAKPVRLEELKRVLEEQVGEVAADPGSPRLRPISAPAMDLPRPVEPLAAKP